MRVTNYGIDGPTKGLYKQHCIVARDDAKMGYSPIVYLQRPKWIKDDSCWKTIVESIRLKLPNNFEVK